MTLEAMEMSEDEVLDVEAGGVKGEEKGNSVPVASVGRWRSTSHTGDTYEGPIYDRRGRPTCTKQ